MTRIVSGVEDLVIYPTVAGLVMVVLFKVIQWIMEDGHPQLVSGGTWPPPMDTCTTTVIIDIMVTETELVKMVVSNVDEMATEQENVLALTIESMHRSISVKKRTIVKYKVMNLTKIMNQRKV